jgi:hypothetical protein
MLYYFFIVMSTLRYLQESNEMIPSVLVTVHWCMMEVGVLQTVQCILGCFVAGGCSVITSVTLSRSLGKCCLSLGHQEDPSPWRC